MGLFQRTFHVLHLDDDESDLDDDGDDGEIE